MAMTRPAASAPPAGPLASLRRAMKRASTAAGVRAGRLRFLVGETVKLWTDKGAPASRGAHHLKLAPPAVADEPEVHGANNPRDWNPLREWRALAKRTIATVAAFSVFVNLLMLTLPIYLFQLSDRVLTSRSLDTLLMLSIVALGFLAVLSLLDVLRRQVLGRLATQFETILGGPVLGEHRQRRRRRLTAATCRRCAACIRCESFISSPVMLLLFDAPLAPLYFAAVFLIHPDLG